MDNEFLQEQHLTIGIESVDKLINDEPLGLEVKSYYTICKS